MKKKLLYFLSYSAIFSVLCILAQIAYIFTKTLTKFEERVEVDILNTDLSQVAELHQLPQHLGFGFMQENDLLCTSKALSTQN